LGNKQKISTENHYRKARAEARAARGDANDPERCVLRDNGRPKIRLIADGSTHDRTFTLMTIGSQFTVGDDVQYRTTKKVLWGVDCPGLR
jgi:hypothetical protein